MAPFVRRRAARQSNDKFGECVRFAGHGQLPTVLLYYDIVADRQAKPGAFPGWLGGEEWLEQLVPDFRGYADAVIAHVDFHRIADIARAHPQGGGKVVAFNRLAFARGVEAVTEQVQ